VIEITFHMSIYFYFLQKRAELISAFKIKGEQKNTGLAAMLDPSIEYEPFDMKELSFSVNGPQCIAAV